MTYEISCKCMTCQLHWNVYSWHENWGQDGTIMPRCPECGSQSVMVWPAKEHKTKHIFQFVPGSSPVPSVTP